MSPEFLIGERRVGAKYPPLVVAEIGINHEGSLDVARQMVDAAIAAGAEVVKHQTHIVEDEMSDAARSVVPGNAAESIYDIIERCALDEEEELLLKQHVESKGAIFISTPFSRAAAQRLESFGVPAYKIGSGECNNYPLVELIASFGKPIILSTGMNSMASIRSAVEVIEKHGVPYALLHCTNLYPTPYRHVRLGGIADLRNAFPNAVVGLSDHCIDHYPCLGAVALGASIIERHFTDSKSRPGPDIACSMDPAELQSLVIGSRAIFEASGGGREPLAEEQVTIDFAFATVVAIADIRTGDEFTQENIWVKRPAVGDFTAADYIPLLGRTAARDIVAGRHLVAADVK